MYSILIYSAKLLYLAGLGLLSISVLAQTYSEIYFCSINPDQLAPARATLFANAIFQKAQLKVMRCVKNRDGT